MDSGSFRRLAVMKFAITLLLLLVMASATYAGDHIYALTYEATMPAEDTKDFIDEMSPFGAGIEIKGFDNPYPSGLSFSLSVHFNAFSSEVSYAAPGAYLLTAAEGDNMEQRDMFVAPVLAHADYHFTLLRDEPPAVPYIGLGVGAYWIKVKTEMGEAKTDCASVQFGFAPEAGVMIPVSPEALLMVGVRYNYTFNSDEPGQQFWTLALGVGYNP